MNALPVADHWFERCELDGGISLIREPHVDPVGRCNIWHVPGRDRDLLVDTGFGVMSLMEEIEDLITGRQVIAVASHIHADHIGGLHEFQTRLIHQDEAPLLRDPPEATLITSHLPVDLRAMLATAGYPLGEYLITAVPHRGYDLEEFRTVPTTATGTLTEGDEIDLGDRVFEVLHLPGHSPGSIALWERSTGILFSGDAVYDGPLIDELPESDIRQYCETMSRLRELPVRVVHGGHDESFNRDRLLEIADVYCERRCGALAVN